MYKRGVKGFVLLLFLFGVFSCTNRREKMLVQEKLAAMYNKEVKINTDSMLCILGDSLLVAQEPMGQINIVAYFGPELCSPCVMEDLCDWEEFINKTRVYQGSIRFYFVFAPSKNMIADAIITAQSVSQEINVPIYIDTLYVFPRENKELGLTPALNVLTLDKTSKIKIVGHLIQNHRIQELFWEEVENRINF